MKHRPKIKQHYPKCLYHRSGKRQIVPDEEAHRRLMAEGGWALTPAAFKAESDIPEPEEDEPIEAPVLKAEPAPAKRKRGKRFGLIAAAFLVAVIPGWAASPVQHLFIPPSAAEVSVSGNADTGNAAHGLVGSVLGVTAKTTNTGTNTHTYTYLLSIPNRLATGRVIEITDVEFLYGVQTSALGTQSATLASGTLNSTLVFSYVDFPTPAASETASVATPVRADSGTLTITPVVASANTATTTEGRFYSMKFTPEDPIPLRTDRRMLLVRVTLQCTATSATVTNSPGLIVHYRQVAI